MEEKALKKKICVYCGNDNDLTKDHIPPRCLFPDPKPADLITVPACNLCNEKFSKDDTYFRDMLILRQDLDKNPHINKLIDTVIRSFKRSESDAYFRYVYSKIDKHDARTRSGIYVGEQPTIEIELNRINNVINRIVKGLHFYEKGIRLSPDYDVSTFSKEYIDNLNFDQSKTFLKHFISPTFEIKPKPIGHGIFKYKCANSNNPNCCIWILVFYDKVFFVSVTLPKDKILRKKPLNLKYPPSFYEV